MQKSEALTSEIVKSNPNFSPAYITLAYIKYMQMNFNQAVNLASKVLEQGEDQVDLSNYVRAILIVAGSKGMIAHYGGPISKIVNGTAVLPNLRKAERLKPDDAGVLFGLGSFYLLAPSLAGGDPDKAKDYLEKTIKADPLFVDAYVRLGQWYKIKGDKQKYVEYLNKAQAIDSQNELLCDLRSGECNFICLGDDE